MADNVRSGTVAAANDPNSTGNSDTQSVENSQNGQAAQPAQAQRPGGWSIFKTLLIRMFFIYLISSFFRRSPQQPTTGKDGKPQAPSAQSFNIFLKETVLDMYVYVSEQEKFNDFANGDALIWSEEELVYGDWTSGVNGDGSYETKTNLAISERVQNNGTIYLHLYFVKAGNSPNPDDDNYSEKDTIYRSKQLNRYKKRKYHTTKNLLTGKTDAHPDLLRRNRVIPVEEYYTICEYRSYKKDNDTTNKVEVLSTWHPNLTINLVDDHTPWVKGSVPQPLDEYIHFLPGKSLYQPIVYFNDYWNLNVDYMPINDTTPVLNFTLTYSPMSLFKWQMYAAQGMRNKWYSFLGEDMMEESDEDQDSLKTTFLETNPYLLAVTIIVSIIHSVFEFLAFKNDIQFWKNRKSMEGLSVRSVFFNVFQSLVVVLYVMDNETNFVVKVSVCIGLAIEVWKIFKVLDFKIDRENKIFGVIPRPRFEDKSTYTESNTKQYDMLAFKYLSWLLFPLLGCYAVYSLMYVEQKGWYSWVLNMVYGFLLTFGFIMMTPQLFINYKLKSVAHLPWRMLTYKALNTFIDDLFAFVIKMPTLYRLGCFRDDIVFLIFLYQRYIYRIDPKRVNEFGTSQEMWEQNGSAPTETSGEGSQEAVTDGSTKKSAQEKKDD